MADPNTQKSDKPFLNTATYIGAGVGALFGGIIENVFIHQGATLVAALLFGVFGAFVPMLFED